MNNNEWLSHKNQLGLTVLLTVLSENTFKTVSTTKVSCLPCITWLRDPQGKTLLPDHHFWRQISSRVLKTGSSSSSCSFYEVKGRAARRVFGVGLSHFQEMRWSLSAAVVVKGCWALTSGFYRLSTDCRVTISLSRPAVSVDLSREPYKVEVEA